MARRYLRDKNGRFASKGTVRQSKTEKQLVSRLERAHPGLQVDLYGSRRSGVSTVSRIVVPKDQRGQGVGTKAMRAITNLADRRGRRLALTPSSDFGGNKKRLAEFYGRHGFVSNTGRGRDYSISETMVREPRRSRRRPK